MIDSKPKFNAIFSVAAFSLGCLVLVFFIWKNYIGQETALAWKIALGFLFALPIFLLLRLFFNYRVVTAGNKKLKVKKLFSAQRTWALADLKALEDIKIKTFNGYYEEIKLVFEDATIKINNQEHTNFEKIKALALKNKPKSLKVTINHPKQPNQ